MDSGCSTKPDDLVLSLPIKGLNDEDTTIHDIVASSKARKLRSACDSCHRAKVRCSGGLPCARCREFATNCVYSTSARTGKPKGSRSRKTIEREKRAAALNAAEFEGPVLTESLASACILRKPTASDPDIPSSSVDGFACSATAIDSVAPESSDVGSISWTNNDCIQTPYPDSSDTSQNSGIPTATLWNPDHTWASNGLDALHQFFPESPSAIPTIHQDPTTLALHQVLPTSPAISQCQCLTSIATLVPPLTTLIGAVSLVTTIIQLIGGLAEKSLVMLSAGSTAHFRLHLGTYDVCDDDEQEMLVRRLLACRLWKLLTAIKLLREIMQGVASDSEEGGTQQLPSAITGEIASVPQLICFDQSLERLQLGKRRQKTDNRTDSES
ncbi:hypothetical protein COCVIDRAFT_21711 [Bipolaris victoriae FI3]|uniref:Zn(2)-C6 fungal-type domain-containing protein n=1 Tax=Bipolaris victoriae (strain FI3) TaxID=930091 RepID=W7EX36_BIPV3|nr:hypothetical protein COCVIDRAFT_21711 [Bipolaris victoriae FI3]